MDKVNRLGWAGTSSYQFGDWLIGVRSADAPTHASIRSILASHLCTDGAPPPNFSVRLSPPDADRTVDGHLHLLFHGCTLAVRTRSAHDLLRELLRRIEEETRGGNSSVLQFDVTAHVDRRGSALLLPQVGGRTSHRWRSQLRAEGWRPVPGQISDIDMSSGELVVQTPDFHLDPAALEAFSRRFAAEGAHEAAPDGRYPVAAWIFVDQTGHDVLKSEGEILARAARLLLNAASIPRAEGLRTIASLLGRTRVSLLPRDRRNIADLARSLMEP